MTRISVPLEHEEQSALIDWTILMCGRWPELKLFYHIPNEGKRSPAAAMRLKQEGMKRGVPDNCLPVARGKYHGLYIELKRIRGGQISEDQRKWIDDLSMQGYKAVICRGWNEAANVIEDYLNEKQTEGKEHGG